MGGTHPAFTDSLARLEGRLAVPEALAVPQVGQISLSPMLLPGGGHVLPVLHRGHVELPPGDVLELSSGNAVSRHLCIAGDDFEPAGPSAQAQNLATLLYSVLEMSWEPSLAKVN